MNAIHHTRKRPAGTGRGFRSNHLNYAREATTGQRLPRDWRERIARSIDPALYYSVAVKKLGHPGTDGRTPCCCPFHDDHNPSATVNVLTGGFRCYSTACGVHHDLLGFHQHITGKTFPEAVRDLLCGGWR